MFSIRITDRTMIQSYLNIKQKKLLEHKRTNMKPQVTKMKIIISVLQAHSNEDEIAVGNLLGEKQDFLEKALHNYILCLKAGVSLTVLFV